MFSAQLYHFIDFNIGLLNVPKKYLNVNRLKQCQLHFYPEVLRILTPYNVPTAAKLPGLRNPPLQNVCKFLMRLAADQRSRCQRTPA